MRLAPLLLLFACVTTAPPPPEPYAVVLGVAQDGGYPQAGCRRPDCIEAFEGRRERMLVASLAIVDPASGERWLIDATPDFAQQVHNLERVAQPRSDGRPLLDGILLTHAHIGHYLGLAQLGREVLGASSVPVFALPRMRSFLEHNGPWSQLVALRNIDLRTLPAEGTMSLSTRVAITPLLVPHRDEFSETAGFVIQLPQRSILWLPDIDKWERWTQHIETIVDTVDVAFVDGTFYSADELPGRDMSQIPHPTVVETMHRFENLPEATRRKIVFIHLNQSNPLLRDAKLRRTIEAKGFRVARQGEIVR